jgi:hypothetical protein
MRRMNCASPRMLVTRSIDGGIALPPTPILVQSIVSPSSSKMILPTTMPFSEATTFSDERVHPIMHAASSSTSSDSVCCLKSFTSV